MGKYKGTYKHEKGDETASRTKIFEAKNEEEAAQIAANDMKDDEKVVDVDPVEETFTLDSSVLSGTDKLG